MQWKGMKEPKEKPNMMKNNGMGGTWGKATNKNARTHANETREKKKKSSQHQIAL